MPKLNEHRIVKRRNGFFPFNYEGGTIGMFQTVLEAIKAKYLCLHDWEVIYRVEYIDGWKILLKCKKCGKLRKKIV